MTHEKKFVESIVNLEISRVERHTNLKMFMILISKKMCYDKTVKKKKNEREME